ncbi:MAG: hypothetical protein ABI137_12130 [Antricoccus sp.]
MEPSSSESAYEGPPSMQRPAASPVVPPVSMRPAYAEPRLAWQPISPPAAAPRRHIWGKSIGARITSSRAPWTRLALPFVFMVIALTNSLPLLTIAPANKTDGITSIVGWSLPAGAWAFVLMLLALVVHIIGIIPGLTGRLNLGVVVGALTVGGGLSAVIGLGDVIVRTVGLPTGEATIGPGPVIAAIAGGLVVVAGVLEFFQLPATPAVRPRLSAYIALVLPILAILAFAPRAIDATQGGRRALGYLDVVTATNATTEDNQALGAIFDQIGNSGWSFGLLNVAGVVLILNIIPALVQIIRRKPTRIPVQLAGAAALLLVGLLALTWFFVSLLGRSSIREALVRFPLVNSPAPQIKLTFAAYLILALGVAALGVGALQATNGFHEPRAQREAAQLISFRPVVHPAGDSAPGNVAPTWKQPIGYRPSGNQPGGPASGAVFGPQERRPPTP